MAEAIMVSAFLRDLSLKVEAATAVSGEGLKTKRNMGKLSTCIHEIHALVEDAEEKQGVDEKVRAWLRNVMDAAQIADDILNRLTLIIDSSMEKPQPAILPIQIFQIGQVVVLNVPGEFTTMAGRRLRAAVEAVLNSGRKGEQVHVVIAGLSNTYFGYITTFEEYDVQRYQGASTLYGPHTLSAYIQELKKLATALMSGERIPSGPQPPDLLDKQISMLPGVIVDSTPFGVNFGDVSSDVLPKSTFMDVAG